MEHQVNESRHMAARAVADQLVREAAEYVTSPSPGGVAGVEQGLQWIDQTLTTLTKAVTAQAIYQSLALGHEPWKQDHCLASECDEDAPAKLRAELVQVAAVAVQWIEAIDKRSAA